MRTVFNFMTLLNKRNFVAVPVKITEKQPPPPHQHNSGGIVGRVKGLVSSTVQYGNTWKDSVQKKSILSAITANSFQHS